MNLTTDPHRQIAVSAETSHGTNLGISSPAWAAIRNLRRLRNPQLAGGLDRRVPVPLIRHGPHSGAPERPARLGTPAGHALDSRVPHQLAHSLVPYQLALRPQRRMDPWTAMDPAARAPDRHHPALGFPDQPSSRRRPAVQPVVLRSPGGTQSRAHARQRQPAPVRHERIVALAMDHSTPPPYLPLLQ